MGIDLGQKKAAFSLVADGELMVTDAYESPAINQPMQLRDVAAWISDAADGLTPDYIFIEEPLMGNNRKYSLNLAKMYGAVLADLAWMDGFVRVTRIVPVNVSNWKKMTVGKGNATKDMVREWLYERNSAYSGLCGNDQDRIDAAAIGIYGHGLTRLATRLISDAG